MLVPVGIVASVTSLVPAAERYTTFQPPTSAADVPVFTSSTNSSDAEPVVPVCTSFTRMDVEPPPPPPPPATQVSETCPEAS